MATDHKVLMAWRSKFYAAEYAGGTSASGVAASLATVANEARIVQDLTIEMTVNEVDLSIRASGWKLYGASLRDGVLNGKILYIKTFPIFKLFQKSWRTGEPFSGFASDGEGGGLVADWLVTKLSQPQPIAGGLFCDFTAKPTFSPRLLETGMTGEFPDWVELGTGSGG